MAAPQIVHQPVAHKIPIGRVVRIRDCGFNEVLASSLRKPKRIVLNKIDEQAVVANAEALQDIAQLVRAYWEG